MKHFNFSSMAKKRVYASLLSASSLISFSTGVQADMSYYMGVSAEQKRIHLRESLGEGMFPSKIPQVNIYGGVKLNQFFGIEGGFTKSSKVKKTAYSGPGIREINNAPLQPTRFVISENDIHLHTAYIRLLGHYLIPKTNWEFIGGIGVSRLKITSNYMATATFAGILSPEEAAMNKRTFLSKKSTPHLLIALQYQLSNKVKLRSTIGKELTGRLKYCLSTTNNSTKAVGYKNSYSYGLGLVIEH